MIINFVENFSYLNYVNFPLPFTPVNIPTSKHSVFCSKDSGITACIVLCCVVLSEGRLKDSGITASSGVIAASLSHAFGLIVAVAVGANISGGHVNPAVTFGAFLGGHITFIRATLYWIAQLLASVVACFLLQFATGGMVLIFFFELQP